MHLCSRFRSRTDGSCRWTDARSRDSASCPALRSGPAAPWTRACPARVTSPRSRNPLQRVWRCTAWILLIPLLFPFWSRCVYSGIISHHTRNVLLHFSSQHVPNSFCASFIPNGYTHYYYFFIPLWIVNSYLFKCLFSFLLLLFFTESVYIIEEWRCMHGEISLTVFTLL